MPTKFLFDHLLMLIESLLEVNVVFNELYIPVCQRIDLCLQLEALLSYFLLKLCLNEFDRQGS